MRYFLLKLLMRLTGNKEIDAKIDKDKMNDWLMGLAAEDNGYKHYYTMRKRSIQEGFTSGITQEQYWFNCGRLHELKYINALSVKLLKDSDK